MQTLLFVQRQVVLTSNVPIKVLGYSPDFNAKGRPLPPNVICSLCKGLCQPSKSAYSPRCACSRGRICFSRLMPLLLTSAYAPPIVYFAFFMHLKIALERRDAR